ncbi:hypothetical protein T440DRAFT_315629 [Plenodomus tracheiphilus IPT5]|uniref:Uncharacterized protein n=1 Tax=Plenodomus tracheiphilus IPT5 TaxID=1408161 RepID=A0A6A7AQC4_9PLEO|nr:hypothetical protein T440DRAFT_315629 [Plenodomus tracheiphilus IPT5]
MDRQLVSHRLPEHLIFLFIDSPRPGVEWVGDVERDGLVARRGRKRSRSRLQPRLQYRSTTKNRCRSQIKFPFRSQKRRHKDRRRVCHRRSGERVRQGDQETGEHRFAGGQELAAKGWSRSSSILRKTLCQP